MDLELEASLDCIVRLSTNKQQQHAQRLYLSIGVCWSVGWRQYLTVASICALLMADDADHFAVCLLFRRIFSLGKWLFRAGGHGSVGKVLCFQA